MAKKVKKMARGGFGMMKPNFNPTNINPQMQNTLKSIASSLQNKGRNSFIPNIPKERPTLNQQVYVQGKDVAPPPQISDAVSRDVKMRLEPNGPTAQAFKKQQSMRPFKGFKSGGTTTLHSITKSNKKSNW